MFSRIKSAIGLDLKYTNQFGKRAFREAAANGNLEKVNRLISKYDVPEYRIDEVIDSYGSDNLTALICAAKNGHTEIVDRLIHTKFNYQRPPGINNYTYSDRHTPLTIAARNGHTEIVKMLVDAGANVNHQTKKGLTALMYAIHANSPEMVEKLVNAGTNLELQTRKGLTARTIAEEENNAAIIDIITPDSIRNPLQESKGGNKRKTKKANRRTMAKRGTKGKKSRRTKKK